MEEIPASHEQLDPMEINFFQNLCWNVFVEKFRRMETMKLGSAIFVKKENLL